MLRACVGVVGALILGTLVLADGKTPASSKVLALVGGRVATQADAGITEATILIRDGKIAAVGHDIAIPADTTKVDVTGMVVTPGLIDARSSLWLTPAASQDT
jgi:imidazolonepropionase-like amidohydrolase